MTFSHHSIVDVNCERFPIWYPVMEHCRLIFCYYFLLGAMGRQHSVLHGCLHHHIYVCICIYVSIITCIMVNANKHSFIHSFIHTISCPSLWHHNYIYVHSHLQVLASILNIQLCSTNDFTLLSDADTNTSASFKGPARTDLLPPASPYRGPFAGGQTAPCVLDLGYRRRALHLSPAEQSGASVRMSNQLCFKI